MNKKILIVTECFYPEEFKINDLAFAWRDKGYEVTVLTQVPSYPLGVVFTGYRNRFFSKGIEQGITVYRVHATTGYRSSLFKKLLKYFSFMFYGTLVSIVIGRRFDYVFGFNMSALTGMVPAVTVKKLYKKPLTFWAQDIWPDSVYAYGFKKTRFLSFFLDKFVGKMYESVDHIAISGKGFAEKLKPYTKKNQNFFYLPNWADDLDMNLEAAKFSEDKKTHFTFAGNVGKIQNLDNIMDAFISIDLEYQSQIQLNIIGDGSHLEELKKKYNVGNIVFHGKKPRSDMAKYYKASDYLIVSLIEKPIFSVTVPSKTQTYIAAKKPILAIIEGDTAQIVRENNLGFDAHPSDIKAIQKVMIKAIKSTEQERVNFIKKSKKLLETTFNKSKIIDEMTNILLCEEI